jgi:hypothetical protein
MTEVTYGMGGKSEEKTHNETKQTAQIIYVAPMWG